MILVTGGTGLVGSHLLLQLVKSENNVRAMYRNKAAIAKTKFLFTESNVESLFLKIQWIAADLNDVSSLKVAFADVKRVYHCAALISFDPKEELQLRKINIEGTANIVNFCIDYQVEKLCFVSSIATLGHPAPHENQVTEATEWNPEKANSDYAISKYGAEMEVWRGQQEGLKVIIINPGVIFGIGFFEHGSNSFFSKIKKGILFYTNGVTGYVSVNDVVGILIQLMNSELFGERYIVISENRSYKSIFDLIATVVNATKPAYLAPAFLTNLYWKWDWLKSFLFRTKRTFSKYNAVSSGKTDLISNQKIVTALNYSFEPVNECIAEVGANFNQLNKKF